MNADQVRERYENYVKPTTPKLWIAYEKDLDDKETISWGIDGLIPQPVLIAAIIRAQTKICMTAGIAYDWFEPCPETKFIIAWPGLDPTVDCPSKYHKFIWFLHSSVPVDQLITMLEVAKSSILAAMFMHQQQAKRAQGKVQLYGSDGRPAHN